MSSVVSDSDCPKWVRNWLLAAGIYNLVWGAIVIAFPHAIFDLSGAERINYTEIWQCVGMIVGVYGVGYLIAAFDPITHWPIVFVGLLGKVLGPIGFGMALWRGTFPPLFGVTILTNDLLWWLPFGLMLGLAVEHHSRGRYLQHYVRQVQIRATPAEVFGFHERPDALTLLIPPWEKMRVVEGSGSLLPGSRVVLAGRVGPIPVRWVAEHTEYDPPRLFADYQVSGPFAFWLHRHRVLDDGQGGAFLRDEVDYQLPLGFVGRTLGSWFVRRKLEAMFAYRHETTQRVVESRAAASTGMS